MPRAQRQCPIQGCTNRIRSPQKRCREHSGWNTSPRTASAAATERHYWRTVIRPQALQRDNYLCQLRYPGRCVGTADQVDHITPVADGGPDSLDNARSCCGPCHRHHTAVDAANRRHSN